MRIGARLSLFFFGLFFFALAMTATAADTVQSAVDALGKEDPSVYQNAVKFLSKHKQEAEPFLRKTFDDSNQPPLARLRAVKLLGDFGDTSAISDLQQALMSGNEKNAAIRVEIVRSLWKLGSNSSLITYLNKGQEASPSVNAAIAISLQGSQDEESKKALGSLLQHDDRRVFRAAAMAVSKTYGLKLNPEPSNAPNPPPTPPPPNKNEQPRLTENTSTGKPSPSPGDQAILDALRSKQTSSDALISQQAASLLDQLSQINKKP